jgi:anti-anti-sigma factor
LGLPGSRIDSLQGRTLQIATRHVADIPLVLDFSGIDYISSVGPSVLMVAARQMREHDTRFIVAALRGVVAEIFAISRFDRVLTTVRCRLRLARSGTARVPVPLRLSLALAIR